MKFLSAAFILFYSLNCLSYSGMDEISIHGFAQFGYARSDSSTLFVDNIKSQNNFVDNSKVGISFQRQFTQQWDVLFQFLSEPEEGEMKLKVDLAQATWRPNSSVAVKVGRVRLPIWMISDYFDVGVLYPWVRPPSEVYDTQPGTSIYGGDIGYSFAMGSTAFDLNVYGGGAKFVAKGNTEVIGDINNILGVSLSGRYKFLTVRGSYAQGSFTSTITSDATDSLGTKIPNVGTVETKVRTDFNLGNAKFISLGFKSEWRNTLLMGEYASESSDSELLRDLDAYYLTAGYYFFDKKYLLHLTHSEITKRDSTQTILTGTQESLIVGANHAVNDFIVLKLEWQRIKPDGVGTFQVDPGTRPVKVWGGSISMAF
ncbi:hypothetical protein A9Q84_13290 [Halobacteriovorax marinus]|uniref:Porin domain-containing protein n=1 Tax=Halobacteriovorax marinus TaxID=97084 RepID=A0A1Y5F930_9BACT|nr:hypothetical protein A9Q84_13290 [Halobacteriovorax marinus]